MINYPLVLIVGPSGQGKTSSIQNLPPEETVIVNAERKFLPFQNANKFEQHVPSNAVKCEDAFTKALQHKSARYVVHDSMTKYFEMLLDYSKLTNKGYEIYAYLNTKVSKYLEDCKNNQNKLMFIFSIDERVEFMKDSGAAVHTRRAWVPGKQWEGKIEKEFTIVLFTDVKAEKGKETEYRFITNNDGSHSAKSPKGMFDLYIPNDLNYVAKRIKEFYGLDKLEGEVPPPPSEQPKITLPTNPLLNTKIN